MTCLLDYQRCGGILEPMNIDEIKKLAELSRLTLSDAECESYIHDFKGILAYIDTIKQVPVGDSQGGDSKVIKNVMREDTNPYTPGEFTTELLAAAPETEGNYIKVNKVL